jgi:hypothetical protein
MSPPGQQVIHFLTVRGCVKAHNNYVKKKSQPFNYIAKRLRVRYSPELVEGLRVNLGPFGLSSGRW